MAHLGPASGAIYKIIDAGVEALRFLRRGPLSLASARLSGADVEQTSSHHDGAGFGALELAGGGAEGGVACDGLGVSPLLRPRRASARTRERACGGDGSC